MNKEQIKGRSEVVKGTVKESAGKVLGEETLELKGLLQNTAGKALAAYGDLKSRLRKAGG
jgi:uncharacterized protein YjbJ (UPF0337 family)